jgi:hypothetical protein
MLADVLQRVVPSGKSQRRREEVAYKNNSLGQKHGFQDFQ